MRKIIIVGSVVLLAACSHQARPLSSVGSSTSDNSCTPELPIPEGGASLHPSQTSNVRSIQVDRSNKWAKIIYSEHKSSELKTESIPLISSGQKAANFGRGEPNGPGYLNLILSPASPPFEKGRLSFRDGAAPFECVEPLVSRIEANSKEVVCSTYGKPKVGRVAQVRISSNFDGAIARIWEESEQQSAPIRLARTRTKPAEVEFESEAKDGLSIAYKLNSKELSAPTSLTVRASGKSNDVIMCTEGSHGRPENYRPDGGCNISYLKKGPAGSPAFYVIKPNNSRRELGHYNSPQEVTEAFASLIRAGTCEADRFPCAITTQFEDFPVKIETGHELRGVSLWGLYDTRSQAEGDLAEFKRAGICE